LKNLFSVEELTTSSLVKPRLNEATHFSKRRLVPRLLLFKKAEPLRNDLARRRITARSDAGRDEILQLEGNRNLERS
jgi:hypothetical protein